jgi:hypothetical protein
MNRQTLVRVVMGAVALVLLIAAVVLLSVGVIGPGSSTTIRAVATPPVVTPVKGKPCPADPQAPGYYMQCAAAAPGQAQLPTLPAPKASASTFGVDSYGAVSTRIAYAKFDCTYLSGYPGGKDWTAAGLRAWEAHGAACVVWETSAARALTGYSSGVRDAEAARHEAAEVGFPTYVPIHFAVDTETSAAAVRSYFTGVKSVLGSRTGVYGSDAVVAGLEADGLTTARNDWQTVAWSYGHRSRACLYQASINHYLSGYSVDYDYASCADYGQVPYKQKPARPICFGKHAAGSKTCRTIHKEVAGDLLSEQHNRHLYRSRGCVKEVKVYSTLVARRTYFRKQLHQHPHTKRAKREKALHATTKALKPINRVVTHRRCLSLNREYRHRQTVVAKIEKAYS